MKRTKCGFAATMVTLLFVHPAVSGTISGNVKVEAKKIPTAKPIDMETDPDCAKKHGTAIVSERTVVDANKNVANVFVYVKSGLDSAAVHKAPRAPVVVDQNGCVFSPHVFGMQVGQPIKVLNSDGVLHNVHIVPQKNREINKAMPAFRKKMTLPGKVFRQEEVMIPITCDAHPWMRAYAGVLNHPYFAVTGADGSFEIQNVPPGTYVVEAWHEFFENQNREITVAEAATTVSFTLTASEKK